MTLLWEWVEIFPAWSQEGEKGSSRKDETVLEKGSAKWIQAKATRTPQSPSQSSRIKQKKKMQGKGLWELGGSELEKGEGENTETSLCF